MQMRIDLHIFIFLFLVAVSGASGQDNTPPAKPEITYVTVDTSDNDVVINWTGSSSPDVEKYIIYYEIRTPNGFEGVRLDSVGAGITTYTHSSTESGFKNILYSVTAVDSSGNESIRKPGLHSTIHSAITYDSCNHTNIVKWNRYVGWNNNVSGYRIYGRNGSGPFSLLTGNNSSDTVFMHSNVSENTTYSYYITGIKNDGLESNSNICSKFTYAPAPPDRLVLNYATVKDKNTVELSFEFSGTSEVNDFALLRSSDITAAFSPVKYILDAGSSPLIITDNILTQHESYYYRVGAVNTCLSVLDTTNLARNILLKAQNEDNVNKLKWDNYMNFPGGISGYEIYRGNQSGEYSLAGTTSPSQTEFEDDLSEVAGFSYHGKIFYRVHAVGVQNGIISVSNEADIQVKTKITAPTAFTPNADGKNDVFKPVLDFIPEDYSLVVMNRYGTVIYRSGDPGEGWDGTINGNQPAPEGIYTYYIRFTSYNGQKSLKKGSVTVFYP